VIEHRLDDVRLDAELGHAGCDGATDIVDAPSRQRLAFRLHMTTKASAKKQPQIRRLLTVCDGQEMLGSIEEGRTCIARNAAGDVIGTFENRKAAMKAVQNTAQAS
jgi:hypothetical protein